jgi:PKD repeat protein
MQRIAFPLAVSLLAAAASAQLQVVIPAGMATAEGSTANAFPWGRGGTGLLLQCVYDSSHFTTQGITQPIIITGLKWRPNTNVALVASSYTAGCSVKLSTSPVDHTAVSNIFANNRGADLTTCYSGVVSWAAQPAQPGPTPFGISVPFQTNFFYDPAGGDLNIECDLPIQTFTGTGPQLDVHGTAGQALASRVFLSTGYPTGNGTIGQNHAVVVEVTYISATGLFASFNANVTSGASPLAVSFTSASITSAPGGITSYAWDFDGDSVVDSTAANPTWTYATCGDYTVSLTVTDGVNAPNTQTRANYIRTDNVTPSFTVSQPAPTVVQFTDTSTPTPTSWAWDFDGDNVVDSTAQNPVWVAPSACSAANVTLTVNRLCKGPFTTSQGLVLSPSTLTTAFTGGNGLTGVGTGNTFDIQVTNPQGITICALSLAPYMATPSVGTPLACTVWVTDAAGGYAANHTNAAVWRQVATGSGTFAGGVFTAPVPTPMTLSNPIYLPAGTFGMAVHMTAGSGMAYTTLTASATYAGPDFVITAGNAKGAPFNTTANANRGVNCRIHYSTATNVGLAGYGFFGAGCAGTLGIPRVENTSLPTIGGTLNTTLTNLQAGVAVMVVGVSNTVTGGVLPLPLDLAAFGAPGCRLRVSLDVTDTVIGAGNTANWSFGVPNNPAFIGFQLFNQAASLDTTNAFGFVMSDAYAWMVGI